MSGAKEILQRRIQRRAHQLWQEAGSVDGKSEEFWLLAEQQIKQEEQDYDETLEDSCPASDPPANSGFTS
jgi:hypothetical protein